MAVTADRRDLDPAPTPPWQPTSSNYARREALERCREAVARAKAARGEKYGEGQR